MVTQIADVVDGVVSHVNDHGVRLAGEADWRNLSKFSKPRPVLPQVGDRVRLSLDGGGYVRAVELLGAPLAIPGWPAPPAPEEEPYRYPERGAVAAAPPVDREQRICRQAVLNTAVALLSSGGRACEPRDVLALASTLEQWVSR